MAGFSYSDVGALVTNATDLESTLQVKIASLGSEPSAADLLTVQSRMQQWSLLVDLASQMAKTLSETLKSVVQKAS